jgi:hypothetical protein
MSEREEIDSLRVHTKDLSVACSDRDLMRIIFDNEIRYCTIDIIKMGVTVLYLR